MPVSQEDKELLLHAKSVANVRCNNMLQDINSRIKSALKDASQDIKDIVRMKFAFTQEGTKRVVFESDNEDIKSKMIEVSDCVNSYLKEFYECGIDVVLKMDVAFPFPIAISQVSIMCWSEDSKSSPVAEMMAETFKNLGPIKVEG